MSIRHKLKATECDERMGEKKCGVEIKTSVYAVAVEFTGRRPAGR
jgi:hypothetical protein